MPKTLPRKMNAPPPTLKEAPPRKTSGRRVTGASRRASTAARAVAVETLPQQADQLGLLDPLDAEPATVFSPGEGEA